MMKLHSYRAIVRMLPILLASSLMFSSGIARANSGFGTNLVTNGDAELGSGTSIPDFSTTSSFEIVNYGVGGGFPTFTDPGPSNRGLGFFAGGSSTALSSASQTINLSFAQSVIDGSAGQYSLSAFLGGFSSQGDHATLQITFLGASNSTLGTAALSSVSNNDRNNVTGLLFRETSGIVPVGTLSAQLQLSMHRTDGSYNDGYADNLFFAITPVPEPDSYAMLLAGLGLMGFVARRRKQ